ncbi:MAG TPA: low affinity iron permease family protein [Sphingomonadaceae bacterium]|nr:low affinity iron permease family protein [Sphingomonadaceae bacterium]
MDRIFSSWANRIAGWAGQPLAFILAACTVLLWAASGWLFHYSDTWQLVINTSTTIVTFLMVFLIKNAQNRDAAALQAKLDELIRATETARNHFIGIEHMTDREVELIRQALEKEYGDGEVTPTTSHAALQRLLARI